MAGDAEGFAAALVEKQLEQMREAARQEGIQPGTPLGVWMSAMEHLTMGHTQAMREAIKRANQAAEANLAAAEASARRADAEARKIEARGEQVIAALVEKMVPAAKEALAKAVVIRERQRGRWVTLGMLGAGAGAGLALFVAGYWTRAAADRPAVAFHSRCLAAAVRAEGGTRLYCPVDVLQDGTQAGARR